MGNEGRAVPAQAGQMLLVVVLVMIVALTVGLSVVSRTITNLRLSKQNEQSQLAFQAAEAGIEQALQSNQGSPNALSFANNASYTSSITNPQGKNFLINEGDTVTQDEGGDVWLSQYPGFTSQVSGAITVYWSTDDQTSCVSGAGSATRPAIEVIVLSGSTTNPTLNKYLYDNCARIPGAVTNSPAGGVFQDTTFNYKTASINVTQGIIMKVIPIYASSKIGISSSVDLPTQGTVIDSTGISGETVRKVRYFSSYPQIPLEVFPYSIISQ